MKEIRNEAMELVSLKKEKKENVWKSPSRTALREIERLEDSMKRRRLSKINMERRIRKIGECFFYYFQFSIQPMRTYLNQSRAFGGSYSVRKLLVMSGMLESDS